MADWIFTDEAAVSRELVSITPRNGITSFWKNSRDGPVVPLPFPPNRFPKLLSSVRVLFDGWVGVTELLFKLQIILCWMYVGDRSLIALEWAIHDWRTDSVEQSQVEPAQSCCRELADEQEDRYMCITDDLEKVFKEGANSGSFGAFFD